MGPEEWTKWGDSTSQRMVVKDVIMKGRIGRLRGATAQ